MPRLILLRHGQSQWNLENRFTGWVDVDLTDQGRAEARAAGVELARNAQGFAASQIARGADAASVFAAQIAALTRVEPVTPPEGQVIDAYELGTGTPEETAAPDDTGTPVDAPTTPLDEALTPSEVATTLLDPLTEAEADA